MRVRESIGRALEARDPVRVVQRWVERAIASYVTPENLRWAISNNVDILSLALNHYHLGHPAVFPGFQLLLKMAWEGYVEPLLTSVPRVYAIIASNPANKQILDSPEGMRYLHGACESCYRRLHQLAFMRQPE